jgi:hypothetical protein
MMYFALCYTVALVAALGATADAGPLLCTIPASIKCTLQTAGVRDPTAMTESLLRAQLRTVSDVTELSAAEAVELFGELRAASVPLGDRARLRKAAWVDSITGAQLWSEPRGEQSAMMFQSGSLPPSHEELSDKITTAGNGKTPGPWGSDRERGPIVPHRQLQSGGGGSIEVVAIAFTGLIGMVGYVVQARSAQKASQAQASLGREVAEREKAEAKAGKQLERVQLQMAEWVRPFIVNANLLQMGWIAISRECKLLGYIGLHDYEYVPQPATPYIELLVVTNPAAVAANAQTPYAQLPPEDLALLAADPALRSRYCELVAALLLSPLRRLSLLFTTKFHLNESLAPARLDPVLPGIGRDWTSLIGSLSVMYYQLGTYAAQFESLAVRWKEEQFDLLQPDTPGLHIALMYLSMEQLKDVSTKELQLVGASSGSRDAAGGNNFMRIGANPAGGGKDAET